MELRRKRIIGKPTVPKPVQPAKAVVPKETRKKKTSRSYSYRGVHFFVVPHENVVRMYTVRPRSTPEYQCTVELVDERKAVYAIAKLLLAESELQELVVADDISADA
jgi:hypothetical protein